jgi:hypothetical protein
MIDLVDGHIMRAPRHLLPTENFPLSIGVGALLPVLILVIASLSEAVFVPAVILAPFVSGFSASVIFGSRSPGGMGYCVITAIVAAVGFYVLLVAVAYATLLVPIAGVVYLSLLLFPFSFLITVLFSVLGAILGWTAAESRGR